MGTKGCLGDVGLCHTDLMETLRKVHFREPSSVTQIVQEFVNCRKKEPVFDDNGV